MPRMPMKQSSKAYSLWTRPIPQTSLRVMAVYRHGLHNRTTVKREMRPAFADHR
jgi:hypothetical protein